MAKRFGKWEVVPNAALGAGGQGRVITVTDSENPGTERFALKLLKNKVSGQAKDRFRKEVRAVQKIDHPGVIKLVDSDLDCNSPFYVMPLYANGSLADADIQNWTIDERFRVLRDVLRAAAAVHSADVIHRDLKPQNILMDGKTPILSDFGICFVEDGQRVTLTDEQVGARNWIPPELELGHVEEMTAASDVYLLGKVIYWALAGREVPREYFREKQFDLTQLKRDERFELVNRLLDRMITQLPAQRFKDATEALAFFDTTVAEFEVTVNVPSRTTRQRCIYCGIGEYKDLSTEPSGESRTAVLQGASGVQNYQGHHLRVARCNRCGNVQVFNLDEFLGKSANPWFKK